MKNLFIYIVIFSLLITIPAFAEEWKNVQKTSYSSTFVKDVQDNKGIINFKQLVYYKKPVTSKYSPFEKPFNYYIASRQINCAEGTSISQVQTFNSKDKPVNKGVVERLSLVPDENTGNTLSDLYCKPYKPKIVQSERVCALADSIINRVNLWTNANSEYKVLSVQYENPFKKTAGILTYQCAIITYK